MNWNPVYLAAATIGAVLGLLASHMERELALRPRTDEEALQAAWRNGWTSHAALTADPPSYEPREIDTEG